MDGARAEDGHVDPNDPTVVVIRAGHRGAFKQAIGYLRQFWLAMADADAAKDVATEDAATQDVAATDATTKDAAAKKVARMSEACEALHKAIDERKGALCDDGIRGSAGQYRNCRTTRR